MAEQDKSSKSPIATCRVFISYSHDSPEHQQRVLALANQLRKDGVEAWIDQYVDPGEGWIRWMRSQVKEARKVLLVFTETYQRRFEGDEEEGKGLGATFEGVIVTQALYESGGRNAKFRPVVLRQEDEPFITSELRQFNRYRVDTLEDYQELLRWLHDAPRIVAPTVSQKPELPTEPPSELFPRVPGTFHESFPSKTQTQKRQMNHVFLSYRHESDEHAKAVRTLGEMLKAAGIPVELDQFYVEEHPGGPDEGWRIWCEDRAEQSACVLIACSKGWFDSYRKQGPPGKGLGAALEAAVFSDEIYDEKGRNARLRLVNLDIFAEAGIPRRLKDWHIFRPFNGAAEFDQMTKWIRKRLAMPGSSGSPPKVAFLAECAFDMREERKKLQSFLEDRNWQVRPTSKYDLAGRDAALQADLRDSLAFVQLLESYPRESGFDRQQREAAKPLRQFLFRDDKIALDQADEQHRKFLNSPNVITSSFDDFQVYVADELDRLWEKQKPEPVKANQSRKALVRVVVRSQKREQLWDKVFEWIDNQADIRSHLLEENEKFMDKQDANEPCHGLLIVCDGSALRDQRYSLTRDMEDCSLIQLKEKDEPPVGLVYWRPPRLRSWAQLLHRMPPRLHRILGDTPDNLIHFFEDVRRVAK